MLALGRNALICDMAETYRIFDIRSIPVKLLAVLASGLGVNSRIKLKEAGLLAPWDVMLLATIVDMWSSAEDKRIAPLFCVSADNGKKPEFKVFSSKDDFEREKANIIAGSSQQEER